MDKQHGKRVKSARRWTGSGNTHIVIQNNTRKYWKTSGYNGIHRFWFKKFTSIHDRLVLEINHMYLNGWPKERPL